MLVGDDIFQGGSLIASQRSTHTITSRLPIRELDNARPSIVIIATAASTTQSTATAPPPPNNERK